MDSSIRTHHSGGGLRRHPPSVWERCVTGRPRASTRQRPAASPATPKLRLKIRVDSRHPVVVMASFDKVLPIHRSPSGRGTRSRFIDRGRNGRPGQAEDQCRGSAKDQSAARNPSELYGAHVTPQTRERTCESNRSTHRPYGRSSHLEIGTFAQATTPLCPGRSHEAKIPGNGPGERRGGTVSPSRASDRLYASG